MATTQRTVRLGNKKVGDGQPVYIVAEIGINHNGDLAIAKQLIDAAAKAGADAVKFQKRTPELCVPEHQKNQMRETPWGYITYLEYRKRIEFGEREYRAIDTHCKKVGIDWFVSVWDEPSVGFMEKLNPICYKIPSAALTDATLLARIKKTGRPAILSTGMSTPAQIERAVRALRTNTLIITHATSTYPCDPKEINLTMIPMLRKKFAVPVGYSGHEVGLPISVAAAALGACFIERHFTLSRSMWGSDQAASVEPAGLVKLVRYIRVVEQSLGDGRKRVYDSEKPALERLRRFK